MFVGITTAVPTWKVCVAGFTTMRRPSNAGRVEDETFYGAIYAAEPEDDPHDEKTWYKANPSLGTTAKHPLKLSTFRADLPSGQGRSNPMAIVASTETEPMASKRERWLDVACPRKLADWDAGQPSEQRLARSESTASRPSRSKRSSDWMPCGSDWASTCFGPRYERGRAVDRGYQGGPCA